MLITVGPPISTPYLGSVCIDEDTGVRDLVSLFIEKGHRRIGIINFDQDAGVLELFCRILAGHGVEVPSRYRITVPVTLDAGARAFEQMMLQPDPPTALFIRKDELALGALRTAQRLGIRVPEDVSIAGFDDLPLTQLADPPLTTIALNAFALGQASAQVLLSLINDQGEQTHSLVHPTGLVVRATVAVPAY